MKQYMNKKEMIIDKTLRLIGEKGTSDISVRDITEAANINVGAVNYHFQNKENLFKAVETLYISNMNRIFSTLNQTKSPMELLVDCGLEVMAFVHEYPGILVVIKEDLQKDYHDRASEEVLIQSKKNIIRLNQVLDDYLHQYMSENLEDVKTIIISSILFPSSSFISLLGPERINYFSTIENRKIYIKKVLELFVK